MPKMVEDFENSQSSEVKYTIVGLVSLVGLLSLVAIYFEHIPDTCKLNLVELYCNTVQST